MEHQRDEAISFLLQNLQYQARQSLADAIRLPLFIILTKNKVKDISSQLCKIGAQGYLDLKQCILNS